MNADFWPGKRVFLTGHTGFKGAWLSLWLQRLGAEVTGFALDPLSDGVFLKANVAKDMHSIIGDIRTPGAVTKALVSSRADIVIHLAAQALVRESYTNPLATFETNIMGTARVFEAVRHAPTVRTVVNVTSDKCYQNREWHWPYREEDTLGGRDPYSASKACAEIVGAAMRDSFLTSGANNIAVASARAGNVIGGGDVAQDRLVPDLLAAFSARRPAILRNPNAIRPWQHVLEPLSGYLWLAERLHTDGAAYAEAWNFGPMEPDMRTVASVADGLAQRWGDDACWKTDDAHHPHEAKILRLEASKARARLGWHPRWSLDRTLDAIIAWHRAAETGADMRTLTLQQIIEWES